MLDDERFRMRLAVAQRPVGQQRGFARAGFAHDDERLVVLAGGVLVESLKIVLAPDVNLGAAAGVGVVIQSFALKFGRLRTFGIKPVNDGGKVGPERKRPRLPARRNFRARENHWRGCRF